RRPPLCPASPYTTLFRSRCLELLRIHNLLGGLPCLTKARRFWRRGSQLWVSFPYGHDFVHPSTVEKRAHIRHIRRDLRQRLFGWLRSEEHTSELQSRFELVCRLLLEKKEE